MTTGSNKLQGHTGQAGPIGEPPLSRGGKPTPHHGHSHTRRPPRGKHAQETLHVLVNQILPDGTIELTRPSVSGYGLERVALPALEVLARGVAEKIPDDVALMQAIRSDLTANVVGVPLDLTWSEERDAAGRMKGELHGRKKQPKGLDPGQRDFNLEAYLRARYPRAFPAR